MSEHQHQYVATRLLVPGDGSLTMVWECTLCPAVRHETVRKTPCAACEATSVKKSGQSDC